jgi:predicted dithiol-disulfide oxidoreductase (DUF899 family)
VKEKEWIRMGDDLNLRRSKLPMVKIDKSYEFSGSNGVISLSDLFNGKEQLIVYHFMFEPSWDAGCVGCSFFADHVPDLSHLRHKNTEFVCLSLAPTATLEAFKKRMGWTFPWYSAEGSDFNHDFHVDMDKAPTPDKSAFRQMAVAEAEEMGWDRKGSLPGLSVFRKKGEDIYHTYTTYARGLETMLGTFALLDYNPLGRQVDPLRPGRNLMLHDEYPD